MSVQSFREKHLSPTPGKDAHRYNTYAWVDIDGLALFHCKDEEEKKQLIRTIVKTIEHKTKKLITRDLEELDREK